MSEEAVPPNSPDARREAAPTDASSPNGAASAEPPGLVHALPSRGSNQEGSWRAPERRVTGPGYRNGSMPRSRTTRGTGGRDLVARLVGRVVGADHERVRRRGRAVVPNDHAIKPRPSALPKLISEGRNQLLPLRRSPSDPPDEVRVGTRILVRPRYGPTRNAVHLGVSVEGVPCVEEEDRSIPRCGCVVTHPHLGNDGSRPRVRN
jgi:hypothetical protein